MSFLFSSCKKKKVSKGTKTKKKKNKIERRRCLIIFLFFSSTLSRSRNNTFCFFVFSPFSSFSSISFWKSLFAYSKMLAPSSSPSARQLRSRGGSAVFLATARMTTTAMQSSSVQKTPSMSLNRGEFFFRFVSLNFPARPYWLCRRHIDLLKVLFVLVFRVCEVEIAESDEKERVSFLS